MYIKNCGECPFFENFVKEYDYSVGMIIEKGRCHKWHEDEIYETKTPCKYAESMTKTALIDVAF